MYILRLLILASDSFYYYKFTLSDSINSTMMWEICLCIISMLLIVYSVSILFDFMSSSLSRSWTLALLFKSTSTLVSWPMFIAYDYYYIYYPFVYLSFFPFFSTTTYSLLFSWILLDRPLFNSVSIFYYIVAFAFLIASCIDFDIDY
jgi:hypothetical protein